MSIEATSDPIRQQALNGLTASFVQQGHPPQYAQVIAASIIFQTDQNINGEQAPAFKHGG